MARRLALRIIGVAIACLALQAPAMAETKHAREMSPSQILRPADLTPDEMAYYNGVTDPAIKKNFIMTRSYVRLAEKLIAKKIPAWEFPRMKPKGFSAQYLLPNDPAVINKALGIALTEMLTACFENANSPLCQKF